MLLSLTAFELTLKDNLVASMTFNIGHVSDVQNEDQILGSQFEGH